MQYKPTIGLEIHAELRTESKMFCSCLNDSKEQKPNTNICPICLGHPGTLPTINKKAVEFVIKAGLALGCKIAGFSHFDRKNYFYPDLPKGYQISQYDFPLTEKGFLKIDDKKIEITRIHLEEDTGKLVHKQGVDYSLVDFNRAGRPLMELVTEPDISSGLEARQFCGELQLIFRYLDISEANMERGQMRCEVNISLSSNKRKLGTKVEIKNLNSFCSVERSINYEIKRQAELLESGGEVMQETRGWDENKQKSFSQRKKEEAHDYRYLPEPDLPPLNQLSTISNQISLPELPQARRKRFNEEYNLSEDNIQTLIVNKNLADYFEQVTSELHTWMKIKKIEYKERLVKLTANYLLTELQKLLLASKSKIEDCQISPENFAEFITMIEQKEISSSAAQTVLSGMFKTGADPSHIIEDKQLKQVSDESELLEMIKQVIKENQKTVADYKAGTEKALQYLVGRVMFLSRGKANPQVVGEMMKEGLA